MPGLKDFLFGSGALKKATGDAPVSKIPSQPAGIDMGKLAQESADRAKAADAASVNSSGSKSPLSTTMTPMKKAGK